MKSKAIVCFLLLSLAFAHAAHAQDHNAVHFVDDTVETVIRELLSKPEGAITQADMLSVESFLYPVWGEGIIQPNAAQSLPQIKSIDDLKYCLNLKTLDLYGQPILSLDSLSSLEHLQSVSLVYCHNVSSVEALSDSSSLQSISLLYTQVTDFTPVLRLHSLREFVATNLGSPPDLSPLLNTKNLEKFFLRDLHAPTDYTPLTNHTKIKWAELSFLDSEMFNTLVDSWPQLAMINISSSSITSDDLNALASCSLSHIKLYECPEIDDLSPLISQTALTSLFVQKCGVHDVSPLAMIPSLTHRIELCDNPITDFTPLKSLGGLQYLTVSKNDAAYTLDDLQQLLPNTSITLR